MKNINFIIGHRGTGKSSLLQRIQKYQPESIVIDLDAEIIKRHGSIKDIFAQQGEHIFRQMEVTTLEQILKSIHKPSTIHYIVLGAGFSGDLPVESRKIWVQRDSDIRGNVYSDRPSLDPVRQSLQTPLERWNSRTEKYKMTATDELTLIEGHYSDFNEEKKWIDSSLINVRGGFTLLPHQVDSPQFSRWYSERCLWGLDFVEIRDDLLSYEQIQKVYSQDQQPPLLFSFRSAEKIKTSLPFALRSEHIDWPLEISLDPPSELRDKKITVSLHSSADSFLHDLKLLSSFDQNIKWSPEIDQLNQLQLADEWQQKSPGQRSLLPRSLQGKWPWYRLLKKNKMPLNFWREGVGSAFDQPILLQWLTMNASSNDFAAVLGSPVRHSESPSFHREFFKSFNSQMLAIDVTENDLQNEGWSFLEKLGLRWAAVTSPLKTWASQFSSLEESVNTLKCDKSVWTGTSTDRCGLQELLSILDTSKIAASQVVVWGGGGLLPLLRELLPQATFYSHRESAAVDGVPLDKPEAVIWCVGRWNWEKAAHFPPMDWAPQLVIDANYKLDSPGIAYAHKVQAQYISGYTFFKTQALKQQEFWRENVL